jgi:hypothetical protein
MKNDLWDKFYQFQSERRSHVGTSTQMDPIWTKALDGIRITIMTQIMWTSFKFHPNWAEILRKYRWAVDGANFGLLKLLKKTWKVSAGICDAWQISMLSKVYLTISTNWFTDRLLMTKLLQVCQIFLYISPQCLL